MEAITFRPAVDAPSKRRISYVKFVGRYSGNGSQLRALERSSR